jgi:hypothetical protein
MSTPGREYSLDHHLLEQLKFSSIEPENLLDLVAIVVSLKNKYGIVPFAASAQGYPVPNAVTVSYVIDSISINKLMNVLLDVLRLDSITIGPRGIPRSAQFDVEITLGG